MGSLFVLNGEALIVRGWDPPSLGMTYAILCCLAAERAGVLFSTHWAWSLEVLHYVLIKTRCVCKALCIQDAFSAWRSPLGVVLQCKVAH